MLYVMFWIFSQKKKNTNRRKLPREKKEYNEGLKDIK